MAELATIARPYAEAMFKAAAGGPAETLVEQLAALAVVAGNEELRQFADNPKVAATEVYGVITGATRLELDARLGNLLQAVLDNGRLAALPEIARQFKEQVNAQRGSFDATVCSAFPIDDAALAELAVTLEKRFGRKLNVRVELAPELIGGVRVAVGDEVLDTSIKARLEQMKIALTA
jgi:F-type H+-transporting ATPase subunit delta